ncbi:hypothetical protein Tco_0546692 [Tanacetum coccineum]
MVCGVRLGLGSFIQVLSLHLVLGRACCECVMSPSNPSPSLVLIHFSAIDGGFGLSEFQVGMGYSGRRDSRGNMMAKYVGSTRVSSCRTPVESWVRDIRGGRWHRPALEVVQLRVQLPGLVTKDRAAVRAEDEIEIAVIEEREDLLTSKERRHEWQRRDADDRAAMAYHGFWLWRLEHAMTLRWITGSSAPRVTFYTLKWHQKNAQGQQPVTPNPKKLQQPPQLFTDGTTFALIDQVVAVAMVVKDRRKKKASRCSGMAFKANGFRTRPAQLLEMLLLRNS